MASVKKYKVKSGYKWRVQYRDPDGKAHTKQGFRTKNEAQAWADRNATDVRENAWVNPSAGAIRIGELGERWWAQRVNIKPSTRHNEQAIWRVHVLPRWGNAPVRTVTKAGIQEWIATNNWSATTARHAYGLLRQVLAFAVDQQRLKVNPAVGVKLPRKPAPRQVYLTPEQLWRLVDACTVHKELVALLGTVGLRWGEAAGLQVGDVDEKRRRIHVERNAVTIDGNVQIGTPKTHEQRTVTVPEVVMDMLTPLLRGRPKGDWLFPARDGGPMRKPTGRHFLKTAYERLSATDPSFPYVSAHGLRHVAAGLMITAGANVLQVQRQLGHAKPSLTLDVYSALWEEGLDELGVEMNSLLKCRGNVVY